MGPSTKTTMHCQCVTEVMHGTTQIVDRVAAGNYTGDEADRVIVSLKKEAVEKIVCVL